MGSLKEVKPDLENTSLDIKDSIAQKKLIHCFTLPFLAGHLVCICEDNVTDSEF